jgi:hypothetical protein
VNVESLVPRAYEQEFAARVSIYEPGRLTNRMHPLAEPGPGGQIMNDPLCFPTLQPKSTKSFLAASAWLADTDSLYKIRSGLPMYLFSGSEVPIGQQLQGIRTLIARYRQAGIRNISHDFYEGGPHEMFNELNRGQVRTNILVWPSSVLHDQSRNREALWPL